MNNDKTIDLNTIAEELRNKLAATDSAREKTLPLCREVIRHSSEAIRAVHRQEYKAARSLLVRAASHLDEVGLLLKDHATLLNSGLVHDAQKEFAEGSITLALVSEQPIPHPEDLKVTPAAYLNGLGEAVGELRRHLLDSLRRGQMEPCERLLARMDDIYGVLVTIDFPDAITGGLRRTTDVVRGILEKTRGDLTLSLRLQDLEKRLQNYGRGID